MMENLSKMLTRPVVACAQIEASVTFTRVKSSTVEMSLTSMTYTNHKQNIKAVLRAPKLENVSQLRSYLGLVNCCHKFLPHLATMLHPLNSRLQKGAKR